jgi:hypothetical protein
MMCDINKLLSDWRYTASPKGYLPSVKKAADALNHNMAGKENRP